MLEDERRCERLDADDGAFQEERNSLQFLSFLGSAVLCLKMDVDNGDPSGFNSSPASYALNSHNIELNKKRKLQGDQLGLPIPKHKCWGHQLPTEPLTRVEENQGIEDFFKHDLENEISDRLAIEYDCSHAKDSNSFVGDSESVLSLCGDSKFDSDVSKIWSSDAPSTSSFSFGCSSSTISQSYSDDTAGTSVGKEDACGGVQLVGDGALIKILNQPPGNQQLIKNSSSTFLRLCCNWIKPGTTLQMCI